VNSYSCFFSSFSYFLSSSTLSFLKFAETKLSDMSFSSLLFGLVFPKFGPDDIVFTSLGFEFFVAIWSDL
jgi:hypothetical protein